MKKILFVCTGNICRSPSAEAVFRHFAKEQGREAEFEIDSAGTHAYHIGERPDLRAIRAAESKGIDMQEIVARKIKADDFEYYDLMLAMDKGHYDLLQKVKPKFSKAKIELFMNYCDEDKCGDVPDPYYGSDDQFKEVLKIIENGVKGFLKLY